MDFGSEFLNKLVKVISCFVFRKIALEFRENFAQILISYFAKISRNWRKISRNTKLKISWNFRENTKTKIFAATLKSIHTY